MRFIRFKKPVFLLTAFVFALVALFGAFTFDKISNAFKAQDDIARVTLRNFSPGSLVDYRVLSNVGVVNKQRTQVDEQGTLSLPISKDVLAQIPENSTIKYELNVSEPDNNKSKLAGADKDIDQTPAELLNLLLSINPKEGSVDLSMKGLEEFSNIIMKENNLDEQSVSADWSGAFSTILGSDSVKNAIGKDDYNRIQLAFQHAGIRSDLLSDQAGMPVVEVFALTGALLGTGSRDKQTAHWSGPIAEMTQQFSAVMMQQTTLIGMLMDASIQLETQRKLQELQARAHKDYHPSEQMCKVGSFVRSVAHSESKAEIQKEALNKYLINQYTAVVHTAPAGGPDVYEDSKIRNFRELYCHSVDSGSAAGAICEGVTSATTAAELEQMNKDIDYTRSIEARLTLDVDFTNGAITQDETDIMAMARHLYFPSAFNVSTVGALTDDLRPHFESRSYAAKMGVAHNSFINIIGMKSAAPVGRATTATTTSPTVAPFGTGSPVEDPDVFSTVAGVGVGANGECSYIPGGSGPGCIQTTRLTTRPPPTVLAEDSGWAYMKALLRDNFGLAVSDIDKYLGERPSYYAQMEVLTKKVYQDPKFYINLYDKPANVKRIGAAMDAILLMNQRDRFESLLRREMIAATLIENTLYDKVYEINSGLFEEMQRSQLED